MRGSVVTVVGLGVVGGLLYLCALAFPVANAGGIAPWVGPYASQGGDVSFGTGTFAGNLLPSGDNTRSLGSTALRWTLYTRDIKDPADVVRILVGSASSTTVKGAQVDGAAAIGVIVDTNAAYSNATARLASFRNNGTEKLGVQQAGKLMYDATDSSGTPGAVTINKPSGKAAIAAGASSVVVTNSTVTTASIVTAVIQTNDATCNYVDSIVPASGSFTVTANANCTVAATVGFIVSN